MAGQHAQKHFTLKFLMLQKLLIFKQQAKMSRYFIFSLIQFTPAKWIKQELLHLWLLYLLQDLGYGDK